MYIGLVMRTTLIYLVLLMISLSQCEEAQKTSNEEIANPCEELQLVEELKHPIFDLQFEGRRKNPEDNIQGCFRVQITEFMAEFTQYSCQSDPTVITYSGYSIESYSKIDDGEMTIFSFQFRTGEATIYWKDSTEYSCELRDGNDNYYTYFNPTIFDVITPEPSPFALDYSNPCFVMGRIDDNYMIRHQENVFSFNIPGVKPEEINVTATNGVLKRTGKNSVTVVPCGKQRVMLTIFQNGYQEPILTKEYEVIDNWGQAKLPAEYPTPDSHCMEIMGLFNNRIFKDERNVFLINAIGFENDSLSVTVEGGAITMLESNIYEIIVGSGEWIYFTLSCGDVLILRSEMRIEYTRRN